VNNHKDANESVCLCFWAAMTLVLTACSSPFDRKMGLSDLDDPNPTIRIMAVKWAGDNKVQSAVPRLVELLQDEDESVRFYAIEGLRRITGTDNGYDYKAGPQRRAEAVERWRQYLKSQESK
jgi:hypothetical protein